MIQTVILTYPSLENPLNNTAYRGKFLRLMLHEQQYLIFASSELHRFHNQILAHFLTDRNIPHHWAGNQVLEIKSPELTVIGGGEFRINATNKSIELWDNSQAYGRFDERVLPEQIASAGHPWSVFSARIS